jgi:hypothetical protein
MTLLCYLRVFDFNFIALVKLFPFLNSFLFPSIFGFFVLSVELIDKGEDSQYFFFHFVVFERQCGFHGLDIGILKYQARDVCDKIEKVPFRHW